MRLFNKLPDARREPLGMELTVLKHAAVVLLAGTVGPLLYRVAQQLLYGGWASSTDPVPWTGIDAATLLIISTVWSVALPVAIACITIVVMKGPGYVADAYELPDSERPLEK